MHLEMQLVRLKIIQNKFQLVRFTFNFIVEHLFLT